MMRSFLERLLFMNLSYDNPLRKAPGKRISSAFFFTMNLPEERAEYYLPIFESNTTAMEKLGGKTEYLASFDTYQFTDYEKYAAGLFDPIHKKQVRDGQFAADCRVAYEIGAKLARAK